MGRFNHPLPRISCRPCFLPPLLGKACKYVGIFHPDTVDLFHGHAWIIPKKKLILGFLLAIYGECELILRRNKRDGTIIS